MKKLFYKFFGEPIWIETVDGEMIHSRLKRLPCGKIIVRKIVGWVTANADGTTDGRSYVKRWYPR